MGCIGCSEKKVNRELVTLDFFLGPDLMEITINDIGNKGLKDHDIEIYDVEYHKDKSYQAFSFDDILHKVYGEELSSSKWTSVSFVATDGYNAVIDKDFFWPGRCILSLSG